MDADCPEGRFFVTADVFTDRPFGGNPLAVVPDAAGLDGTAMQAIAREFNLSETTFVLPSDRADCDLRFRIFSPQAELPFAGHPTIGGVLMLAALGRLSAAIDDMPLRLVIEEQAGPVAVELRTDTATGARRAVMGAPICPAPVADAPDREALAALLGLSPDAIADGAAVVSAGLPFLFVPLMRDADLDRCRADLAAFDRILPHGSPSRLVYPMVVDRAARRVRARMFGPSVGIAEDPATGSAAMALAGWLAAIEQVLVPATVSWTIVQGEAMGRPSRLDLAIDLDHTGIISARLSGEAVMISRGWLLPAA
ncbi:phenazine biosynthesis protein PhzF [Tistrella bauzanensis]|uniref:Phenazine biosynthesis protein PhzF n=1 Tax=Tistrella bauzanensis TaxID=657419 RepID=A0ABQ1I7M1_9PROT|nr:PhzF family phenazine biosynthesis protein [Tistrella bauzanensis]GGB24786.1 phenazine biosynthesis protein PhzF [Tistrella bauzanensis]